MAKINYSSYRFPPEIIQQAIWLYLRFSLSFHDVEDLLAERGVMVSYETVRRWVIHFGPKIAADLRKTRPKPHTTWHLDEVYLKIDGGGSVQHRGWCPRSRRSTRSTFSAHLISKDASEHRRRLGTDGWRGHSMQHEHGASGRRGAFLAPLGRQRTPSLEPLWNL